MRGRRKRKTYKGKSEKEIQQRICGSNLLTMCQHNAKLFTQIISVKIITTLGGRYCYFYEAQKG